jgi:hypothetical protein
VATSNEAIALITRALDIVPDFPEALVNRHVRPQTFVDMAGWGDSSESPVFIVGMPRSGTSLVEQIAASHPLVHGGGEQKEIIGILTALVGELTARSPAEWDHAAVRRETKAYMERLHSLGGGAMRVTDKLPDNILLLGQIAVLSPQARIEVCRRDPRDVGLSCFFQYFRDDPLMWTDDLADCGFRAQEIDRLMQHWRKVLPVPLSGDPIRDPGRQPGERKPPADRFPRAGLGSGVSILP